MSRLAIFISDMLLGLVLLVGGVYLLLTSGSVPINADVKPSPLERWAAVTALDARLDREAPHGNFPLIPPSSANLTAGIDLYANNCAICHGFADGKSSTVARGLYQKPPQFAKDGVEDDPVSLTHWKIQHGIRFTGMPAYTRALSDKQIWQISLFLWEMNRLPPAVDAHWKNLHHTIAMQ